MLLFLEIEGPLRGVLQKRALVFGVYIRTLDFLDTSIWVIVLYLARFNGEPVPEIEQTSSMRLPS